MCMLSSNTQSVYIPCQNSLNSLAATTSAGTGLINSDHPNLVNSHPPSSLFIMHSNTLDFMQEIVPIPDTYPSIQPDLDSTQAKAGLGTATYFSSQQFPRLGCRSQLGDMSGDQVANKDYSGFQVWPYLCSPTLRNMFTHHLTS